ncbi:DUF924 family protein [Scleromatobacter humisilvae]|uniref:DUF924 domain-containing protein n=1 Tax=Scleromatobacter humisilvae TaxID=2897159 RepID=A0A9X2BXE6_9BURK|nr:DUF924 family protein [Scleromatobacter humisilvae]MCK9684347.1 DUF924 domain-containing protein [Scleromatobacter humisilvae]
MPVPKDVLDFWFDPATEPNWWKRSDAFDATIAARFGALHEAATRCELFAWRASAEGRLAEVIVLDQFSRNLHRDSPLAFAADPLALALAQTAVALGVDRDLDIRRRVFLHMPYMHSESRAIHEEALRLFAADHSANDLDYERRHKAIIDRFGRFPHRNAVLGRASTPEELEFLETPGSSF